METNSTILISVSVILSLLFLFYIIRKWQQSLLKNLNIPGPDPNFLMGNLHTLRSKPLYQLIPEWTKKYGKVWGYYEGPTPTVVISDPDLLQEIFVKQFSSFHSRKLFALQPDPDKTSNVSMFVARGERWKRLRTTINPAFSEKRMREMFPLIDGCITSLMNQLEKKMQENKSNELDIYQYFQSLTLDVICEVAFGVEIRSQENPNHPFIKKLRLFFGAILTQVSLLNIVAFLFPEMRYAFHLLNLVKQKITKNPVLDLRQGIDDLIKAKKEALKLGNSRVDLLQLMLEAETQAEGQCPISQFNDEDSANSRMTKNHLTKEEVKSQAILFLFAGYETSSTGLGYAAHALAVHPHVQERLLEELDAAYEEMNDDVKQHGNPKFYEQVSQLSYLDAFIHEVLRYRPFTSLILNRKCMKKGGIKVGEYFIPEGMNVQPDMNTIHQDPEYFGPIDPQIFEPERFLSKENRHPISLLTFGAGPRICIGMRLALLEMKTCLARILHKYRIEKCDKTENPLQLKVGATITPKDGVYVKLVPRHKTE